MADVNTYSGPDFDECDHGAGVYTPCESGAYKTCSTINNFTKCAGSEVHGSETAENAFTEIAFNFHNE